ncbi:PREDICTED: protein artemis-like isoform X3 [Cyphomyrmex costatus]|uniref:Protein artemis n=1 Tax=Cyphomyrmex costatus TaxID=456900 RepID=A0A151I7T0_9HYME|nr:PREDICTED: protein artemis-like isoform X3 [Cyphomyrmex costatus]KYM94225.1 Protein artemis [Cyphomyrmex costatus]
MSTFSGLIEEIPGISVDRFDRQNMNSSAYFLTHCHIDHMHGLNNEFFDHLKQYNKYLYCSRISKVILENKYYRNLRNIETCVKDIAIDKQIRIKYKRNRDSEETDILLVTCTSAGHCLGSVMFIFENRNKLILYTGDFRINPRDYSKIKSLNHRRDFPKKFDKVYLDTTFLDRNFISFPTRIECINLMSEVVKEWLDKSPRNVVILECSALFGSEFLYMELSKSLKTLIHVKEVVYNSYNRIPDLACHITNNPLDARIHACVNKLNYSGLTCRTNVLKQDILIIVPSVLKWKGHNTSVVGKWDKNKEGMFNVCYSMHASFNELEKFIQYFKPKEVYPCVIPKDTDFKTVSQLLNQIRR